MAGNFWGRIGDYIASGNNRDPQTGAFSATPMQWFTGIGSKMLGVVNPVAGQVAGRVADGYYGKGPLASLFNSNRYTGEQLQRQSFPVQFQPVQVPNIQQQNWLANPTPQQQQQSVYNPIPNPGGLGGFGGGGGGFQDFSPGGGWGSGAGFGQGSGMTGGGLTGGYSSLGGYNGIFGSTRTWEPINAIFTQKT